LNASGAECSLCLEQYNIKCLETNVCQVLLVFLIFLEGKCLGLGSKGGSGERGEKGMSKRYFYNQTLLCLFPHFISFQLSYLFNFYIFLTSYLVNSISFQLSKFSNIKQKSVKNVFILLLNV